MDLVEAEEEARRSIRDSWFRYERGNEDYDKCSSSSSIGVDSSMGSEGSSRSSSETTDDASSSPSPVDCGGGLSDLSEIMNHLPIKRGLSKFYNGKSESFTSLSRVLSVEDLAKKTSSPPPHRRLSLKASKSYAQGLNCYHKGCFTHPKPIITKRATPYPSRRHSFVVGCHKNSLPLSHLPENLEC